MFSFFTSCKKMYETDNLSKITYFPIFDYKGNTIVYTKVGSAFTDPGCTATENGAQITVVMTVNARLAKTVSNAVDINKGDIYDITYTATNSDGFKATKTRTVWVYESGDMVNNIAGIYLSTVKRGTAAVTPQYTDMKYVIISKLSANTYQISDALGGYYDIGRNYGFNYAAQGSVITVNNIATNDFSFTRASIPGFGNVVDVSNMTVDPINKQIVFTGTGNFANATFTITLKQVELN